MICWKFDRMICWIYWCFRTSSCITLDNYKEFVCLIDGDSIKRLQFKRHWTCCRINSVTWLNAHTGNYCIGYFLRKREVFVSSYCIAAPSFKIYSLNLSNVVGHQRVLPTGFKNSFVDKSRKILLIKKLCNEIKKNWFVYFKTIYNCFALTQLSDQFCWWCMEKKYNPKTIWNHILPHFLVSALTLKYDG